jgi:lysozyme
MPRNRKKKNKSTPVLIFLLIGMVLMVAGIILFRYRHNFSVVKGTYHASFGIRIPNGYSVHGIDVSRYQRRINWQEVAAMKSMGKQIRFCFIKATQGNDKTDPLFERNWRHSGEAGMIRGAYHYFNPRIKGQAQADYFLQKYEAGTGDLPPVLDIEETGNVRTSVLRKEVKQWLERVEKKLGVKPFIYTHTKFYRSVLGEDFDEYPFWVAHYHLGDEPRIYRDWHFWQHSESGFVNGISGRVDFNVFSGDSVQLEQLRIK